MNSNFKWAAALLAGLLVAGCASKAKITSDYDPSIDFSQYSTYNFYNPMGIENASYSSILGQMFRDTIGDEMHARGYTLSDNPDLLMNVSASERLMSSERASPKAVCP